MKVMNRRVPTPGPKLRFMKESEFEDEAGLLLAEYGEKHAPVTAPPIPIDDIVELFLGLQLEFNDMRRLFGVDDIHGALWVNEKRVGVDQRLDPTNNPAMLGRYRFTLAHEAGHWRLHRQQFQINANQFSLLPESADRPEYICRSSDTTPIEYQANRFASCLLMPRKMVIAAWEAWRGNLEPIYLNDLRMDQQRILGGSVGLQDSLKGEDHTTDEGLLEHAAKPLAKEFEVSPQAMRIRLQALKLLCDKAEPMLF